MGPFGRPVLQRRWLVFRERTGVPVVIDAAASFDGVIGGRGNTFRSCRSFLSLHATKSFGTGTGCVLSTDAALVSERRRRSFRLRHSARQRVGEPQRQDSVSTMPPWASPNSTVGAVKQQVVQRVGASMLSATHSLQRRWVCCPNSSAGPTSVAAMPCSCVGMRPKLTTCKES